MLNVGRVDCFSSRSTGDVVQAIYSVALWHSKHTKKTMASNLLAMDLKDIPRSEWNLTRSLHWRSNPCDVSLNMPDATSAEGLVHPNFFLVLRLVVRLVLGLVLWFAVLGLAFVAGLAETMARTSGEEPPSSSNWYMYKNNSFHQKGLVRRITST